MDPKLNFYDLGVDIIASILLKLDQGSIISCYLSSKFLHELIKSKNYLFVYIYASNFSSDDAISEYFNGFRSKLMHEEFHRQ